MEETIARTTVIPKTGTDARLPLLAVDAREEACAAAPEVAWDGLLAEP
jgi:hypothetical protein